MNKPGSKVHSWFPVDQTDFYKAVKNQSVKLVSGPQRVPVYQDCIAGNQKQTETITDANFDESTGLVIIFVLLGSRV